MEIREFERRPFTVSAVQVTLENVEEVANWCGGKVEMEKVKLVGTETELPCIRLQSQNKQEFTASLGHWIVELKGSFRTYKAPAFDASFVEKRPTVYRGDAVKTEEPVVELPSEEQLESQI